MVLSCEAAGRPHGRAIRGTIGTMRTITLSVAAVLLPFGPRSPAQTAPDHVVVASLTTSPATSLFDVDLANGAITPIGPFGLDRFPPLAVAVDAVNRDVIVALATPTGSSILVRLRLSGTQVVGLWTLGDVPGVVSSLAQALDGGFVTTTGAGVFATARQGSVARAVATLPLASALQSFGLGSHQAVVARSGSPATDPEVRWLDLDTGQTIAGPWSYPGHAPKGITGVADLPTGLSRQLLSQEDGTIAMSVNFANPTVLPLTPALPPGGTVAMHVRGLDGVVLGRSTHPFLKSFQALGGTQWTILAGPIPGDPVDFAFRPPVVPATVPFGPSCGTMRLDEAQGGGPPRLGNAAFGLSLARGQPTTPAFLLLGFSDRRFGALILPAGLPGRCAAYASGEVAFMRTTDPLGGAMVTVGVPSDPTLHGVVVYTQWHQVLGAVIDSSNPAAVHVAR
jgi:hypothetical protein